MAGMQEQRGVGERDARECVQCRSIQEEAKRKALDLIAMCLCHDDILIFDDAFGARHCDPALPPVAVLSIQLWRLVDIAWQGERDVT